MGQDGGLRDYDTEELASRDLDGEPPMGPDDSLTVAVNLLLSKGRIQPGNRKHVANGACQSVTKSRNQL